MNGPSISMTDLSRRFGETTAVDRLTLEVLPGEIFGFSGHNYFSVGVALLLGSVIWLINVLLLWLGSRSFKRGYLIARV